LDNQYSYEKTLKTKADNDFFNLQSFLFVTSKQITRLLYHTPVTPHQVIFLSMVFGITASYLFIQTDRLLIIIGAILLFYKNVLDKVDGSLARAKGLDSRRGRFYDSLSDFIVTLTTFSAIGHVLYLKYNDNIYIILSVAAMIFSMLQCSYFIYYQVSFIKSTGKETVNRLTEQITAEDLQSQDKLTLLLQRLFQIIYGWQDLLFMKLDKMLLNKLLSSTGAQVTDAEILWYGNKPFLTMASALSIGTHIFLICVFAVINCFEYYLFMNLICMNLLLIFTVLYHYISTKKLLKKAVN
jgi:phosphatidylglycerophosphate synthase